MVLHLNITLKSMILASLAFWGAIFPVFKWIFHLDKGQQSTEVKELGLIPTMVAKTWYKTLESLRKSN